jgi:hypothetical protein
MTQSVQIKILLVDDFSDSSKARKKQHFLDDLSNSGPAVRLYGEGRATGPPKIVTGRRPLQENGEIMTEYLVAIHLPDDYDPSVETEAMSRDIDALNDEMVAAGIRIFVGGPQPASSANSLRAQPDGKVLITDGPYLETKEHIGGFWVLEAANLDDALAWGAQGSRRLSGAGRGAPGMETNGSN